MSGVVIAIDGPAGTGKSSVSRGLARRLGARYLDTGSMYRIVTLAMLRAGVDLDDPQAIAEAADVSLRVGHDPDAEQAFLGDEDVSPQIRTDEVTRAVSAVSAVPAVRNRLVRLQRELAAGAAAVVVEGRDIGSVVCPDAEVKVYLTADPSARAARRALENGGADVAATEASLLARDQIDSGRAVAPLTVVDGAVRIDSTDRTLDEVVELVVGLVMERV